MTIAQLSDIHHCKYVPRNLSKVRSEGKCIISDIIALTGDFVYGSKEFISSVAEELSELKAKKASSPY